MHATSRTQLENRSLQHVECPVQERAALLSRGYPSLRLHDLTRADLETLGSYTEVFRAEVGTMIFHEATPGSWMALVVSGEVEIRKLDAGRRDRILATIGPGHLLGEMAFLDGQTRSATAIAAKDTSMLVVTRHAFENLVHAHPTLIAKLLPGLIRLLILRLRRTNVKLVDRMTD
ncbi:MAG: hypothetical protein AUH30_18060 [Candidatus Rokubacteria bacterium 13_1_40CM_68_15]|nr:MAG: hypothetical protein AUH30_18060 [Candidatus Rokubacteria bacterium 13_1_40CM_68_15]